MKFRKKSIVIEAVQYTGTNIKEVSKFVFPLSVEVQKTGSKSKKENRLRIWTLAGEFYVKPQTWIIRETGGAFYPCKSDTFAVTYEPVEEPA